MKQLIVFVADDRRSEPMAHENMLINFLIFPDLLLLFFLMSLLFVPV